MVDFESLILNFPVEFKLITVDESGRAEEKTSHFKSRVFSLDTVGGVHNGVLHNERL